MTINEMAKRAHEGARLSGFHDYKEITTVRVLAWLALAHSEISEALEDARLDPPEMLKHTIYESKGPDAPPKPCGFASEIADVIIRLGDTAAALGIDLEAAIAEKMDYNDTRDFGHNGKRA
jgi:NTP pyrophosphatase (non-canonical NTP hydrolase)